MFSWIPWLDVKIWLVLQKILLSPKKDGLMTLFMEVVVTYHIKDILLYSRAEVTTKTYLAYIIRHIFFKRYCLIVLVIQITNKNTRAKLVVFTSTVMLRKH